MVTMPGMDQLPIQTAEPSADQLAAFEQMREQVSPTEINREMLMTAEQADPVAVAEFRKELAELDVAPEVIDMLNTMVDEVLANPGEYPIIRQKYLDMGVDEEILPEVFDAGLFAALNIALDELRGPENMLPPQGFAKGGIASLNPMAREMAEAGRYGDTMLAHISPVEAQILRRHGGSGTINPMTGMPEFFLKKMFKKLGKTVKKFANTTIGKIVTGTALFMVAGPAAAGMLGASAGGAAAAGISGFVSGAGTSLLAGGNLKDSLRAGAIGGITAGVSKGVMNRLSAPAEAAQTLPDVGTVPADTGATAFASDAAQSPLQRARYFGDDIRMPSPLGQGIESITPDPASQVSAGVPRPGTPMMRGGFDLDEAARLRPPSPRIPPPTVTPAPRGFFENIKGAFTPGDDIGFVEGLKEAYFPSNTAMSRADALAQIAEERGVSVNELLSMSNNTIGGQEVAADLARLTKGPGMLRQFAPLAATGLGIMALGGGFKEEKIDPPAGFEDFMAGPAMQKEEDRLRYGGIMTQAMGPQYNPYTFVPPAVRGAAKGGSMDKEFPRKTGPINGPGTGTSDDIPAMLSDGEFVFTAKAVRGMGEGSRRAGAKKMYALMKKLEGRANG